MLENCLRHKIIRDFLKNYTEKRWKDIIPSLIQIGILNLQKSFNRIVFTIDELKMVLHHLQISQIEKDKERNKEKENKIKDMFKDTREKIEKHSYSRDKDKDKEREKENIIKNYLKLYERSKSPKSYSNINYNGNNKIVNCHNNTQKMKKIEIINSNQEKIKSCNETINEDNYNIRNDYNQFKSNASIDFKNQSNKQKNRNFKKINIDRNKNKNFQRQLDKISYAISYDKDLRPESISKKINKNNNTNTNINNIKTECNYNINSKFVDSSEKKHKNNKINYLNLNLNNINRINIMKNIKRKHYNLEKSNFNNKVIQSYENQKNKFFKKINKGDKFVIKKNKNKKLYNNKVSNSYNRNINFINTLYQGMNTNGPIIKSINYFSNKKELEYLSDNNKANQENLNIKNEIIIRKNKNKSGKPLLSKLFANISDKDSEIFNFKINKEKDIKKRVIKNNSYNRIKTIEQKNKYNNNGYFTKNNNNPKTPKNNNIENDLKPMSFSEKKIKNNIKIDNDINIVKINDNFDNNQNNNIIDNNNVKNEKQKENENDALNKSKNGSDGLKTIKINYMNKGTNKDGPMNFEKVNGKNGVCRYFNIFGYDGDEISLTQVEKDCSGIIDSSTSNEIQMNTDYFFKETPIKNVFKGNKSNNQSNQSNKSNSKDNNEI